jgi:hypothetical protein
LGLTVHVSPQDFRLRKLRDQSGAGALTLDQWLVDVANQRGARVVERHPGAAEAFAPVSPEDLSNEEFVVALCQPGRADEPQMLRPAAQLISRGAVDPKQLVFLARRERAEPILKALALQALRVDPTHPVWSLLATAFASIPLPRAPVLHWTRLAIPVNGIRTGRDWELVS